ncbi:N-acetyl-1-D-myo-inositol-2-amino-2-deoxy-alpha-D-glucopyranoside deacetylase [Cellulomonas massiliensis]|uniref:N-acetyl-1-D-myo-inositol-2-amino-2-deoxy-alpha- D-glucopyranoside deacetylase n=1 Tax=Cellulomonas massiliensis TaxID=1465811 RepID=UPI0002DC6B2B|nr:N-acetyl-1-D-myo-inositol-2-amino-2-deoxy-alpha-D-glucopyranoside deacetylase [Cellulomonas massiliensis]
MPGLVAVHAHPDDETLATGALLATFAAAGAPVTVVTCTRGERGEVIGAELAHLEGDGPALAAHRERELAAALAALGVRDHVFLDAVPGEPGGPGRYEDSGMAWVGTSQAGAGADLPPHAFVSADARDAARRLARVLRARRPDVVATYDPQGGYGHPDHVRTHEVATRAVALAAAEDDGDHAAFAVPVVLWAAQGERALRAAYRALSSPAVQGGLAAEDARELPDPDGPLPAVAVPDERLDVLVDSRRVLAPVLAAMRAHATQVQSVAAVEAPGLVGRYALSLGRLEPVLPAEGYRLADGGERSALRDVAWPAGVAPVA